ncbi:MAG: hypothetical protein ACI9KE_003594 [Polyangiales bacterium]|jgi:hypothetical protein
MKWFAVSLALFVFAQTAQAQTLEEQPSTGHVMAMAFLGSAGGLAVGVGVSTAGAFVGARICEPRVSDSEEPCYSAALIGFATTHALSFAPILAGGVYLAGQAAGGQGDYGVTLLGASLGMMLHGAIALIGHNDPELQDYAILTSPVGTAVGALLAYFLSHRGRVRVLRRWGPTASVSDAGGTLGVAGLF